MTTEAEQKLVELLLSPDWQSTLYREVLAARRAIAVERLPEHFEQDLRDALEDAKAADQRVRDLGRQHPVVCYGDGGLIDKIKGELG